MSHGLGELPALTRVGLLLLLLAGAIDVVVHVAAGEHAGHPGIAHSAHLVAIVGMVLVLAGIVVHGARLHVTRRRRAAHTGGTRDAHR
ncbi:MAG: hypothetical protein ACRDG7_00320 [Candidatus Limnocylindria bacterium]